MALVISTAARNAAADGVTGQVGSSATLKVYTGTQPTDPGTAATGTLLATFALPSPAFAASSAGTANLGTVASVTAAATGTAGWFRIATSAGTGVIDGTCGTSGAQLNLNTTSITSGGSVSITSGSVTMPAS